MSQPVDIQYENRTVKTRENFLRKYKESLENPEGFWGEMAERLHWYKKWHTVKDTSFQSPVQVKWFEGGELNASYNCLDRHLQERGSQPALIWEPNNPDHKERIFTYKELHEATMKMANILKKMGVRKGDRVALYMPMIPEAIIAMLACARLGAPHSAVFAGFSPEALAGRINDSDIHFVVTADEGWRGTKRTPLKSNLDLALKSCPQVEQVLVVRHTEGEVAMQEGRDLWYHDAIAQVEPQCEPVAVDAEHPLFLLYTSGSSGQPKGVLHTTGGYLLYAGLTHEYIFDCLPGDIFWCTADIGWVTGHTYTVYGPLLNGTTTVIHESVPTYPTASRHWEIIDKHKVNVYYTAPTAIRSLMSEGPDPLKSTNRQSLRLLGSVGEPINPEAWNWFYEAVGNKRCPIVDTWWQTETGGILMSPIPGISPMKPGAAVTPFLGAKPVLMDEKGKALEGPNQAGMLCFAGSWPGQMRTIYGDHKRFEETYFATYPGYYFSGDAASTDADGDYWITGRVDDVLNVSGHRLGTAEIESALALHRSVAEAAAVGFPHPIKGEGIHCYVVVREGTEATEELAGELKMAVRKSIGPIATPDLIQFVPGLPKTRSGKIMRRILRKIAVGETTNLGDMSTLADPEVIDQLIAMVEKNKG